MITLAGNVSIQITANTQQDGNVWRDTFAQQFSDWFGGATVTEQVGYYIREDNGKLDKERSTKVESLTNGDISEFAHGLTNLIEKYKYETEQEAVLVTINNVGYLLFNNDDINALVAKIYETRLAIAVLGR